MKKIAILLLAVFSLLLSANTAEFDKSAKNPQLIQQGEKREQCAVCGMNLKKYYRTSHAVELDNGAKKQYCSIRCLADDFMKNKNHITNIYAVDAKTAKLINAQKAYYVIGSSVKGTMSKTSKIAFKDMEDAKAFSKRFNGKKITGFKEAFALAKKGNHMMHKGMHKKGIEPPKDAKCPVCGMFVGKYPSWAAKAEMDEGVTHYFDGAKDMFKYYLKNEDAKPAFKNIEVTDYYTQSAIDAKSSFYVTGSDVFGPMGNELIPFETMDKAKIFLKDHRGVKIFSFAEVTKAIIESIDE